MTRNFKIEEWSRAMDRSDDRSVESAASRPKIGAVGSISTDFYTIEVKPTADPG